MEFRYGHLGLEWPRREDWIEKMVKQMEDIVPTIPQDVWIVISKYCAALGVKWMYSNGSEDITHIDSIHPFWEERMHQFPNRKSFPVLYSSYVSDYGNVDLLPDMKWYKRVPCIGDRYADGCTCADPDHEEPPIRGVVVILSTDFKVLNTDMYSWRTALLAD